jgi:putative phosphoribosyl transferase
MEPIFENRIEAGKALSARVAQSIRDRNALVLGLPRGGVPVAFEVAVALDAELDVLIVRKLGLPGKEERAIGAIASGGVRILNEALIAELQLSPSLIDCIAEREQKELERRQQLFRGGRPRVPVAGRTVIVVDDGLATGASMKAAAQALRAEGPRRILVAVPIAAQQSCHELRMELDEVICLHTPALFVGVGMWYRNFSQTSDQEVQQFLEVAARRLRPEH